jgi:2-oxoisovalerate dehydrogenase E2 component (dihydrolipoyl transacylase)
LIFVWTSFQIKLADVSGTGKEGRILKEDILRFMADGLAAAAPALAVHTPSPQPAAAVQPTTPAAPPKLAPIARPALVNLGEDRKVSVRGIKKAMVKTMTAAQAIPHFGYCDEIDMTALVHLRNDVKKVAAERGIRLSYMPIILKVIHNASSFTNSFEEEMS